MGQKFCIPASTPVNSSRHSLFCHMILFIKLTHSANNKGHTSSKLNPKISNHQKYVYSTDLVPGNNTNARISLGGNKPGSVFLQAVADSEIFLGR